VNWQARLANELPFIRQRLQEVKAKRVLEAACGTGQHGIALAHEGYQVICAEASTGMLRQVRQNARDSAVRVDDVQAGFGEVRSKVNGECDAVLCLGNSLVHALSHAALVDALADFAAVLRPGGILIVQNRNYDKVLQEHQRFMPVETAQRDGKEFLFFRFLDFGDDLITFNMVTMIKEEDKWRSVIGSTEHRPITLAEAELSLREAGFSSWTTYGDYQEHAFDPSASNDLIIVARR
jgi:SAM-dependent methyltransferase